MIPRCGAVGGLVTPQCCSPHCSLFPFLLGIITLCIPLTGNSQAAGSCHAASLCCTDRNATCLGKGWLSESVQEKCYCDQACTKTLDCCSDYHLTCPDVSCKVSEWSEWSGCSEPCKISVRMRQRSVLEEPKNGGKPCPPLQQTAGCAEYHHQHRHCLKSLVPALITTGGYGSARKKQEVTNISGVMGYCVEFELISLTVACHHSTEPHTQWMQYLREGHRVCVECQSPALAADEKHCTGDGENLELHRRMSLQWQAMGNPQCKGHWRRIRRQNVCSCPTVHSFLFI